jgi:cyclopropane-fatty-acyl-phospholipid synthase
MNRIDIAPDEIGPVDPTLWPAIADAPRSSWRAAIARRLFLAAVESIDATVVMPDGSRVGRGGPELIIRSERFFDRIGTGALIGFGEAYMAGDMDAEDLPAVLTPFAERMAHLVPARLQALRGAVVARQPHHERNTRTGARANISRHYDLSNDLFALFLDPTMTYSSALFDPAESRDELTALEDAQHRKIGRLLDICHVTAGTRLLEIGSGWGELALRAAQRGAQVTTITLSTEQQALARQKIAEAGYAQSVDVQLCDYRDVTGKYDAVVSVEMIEAVGQAFWPDYFQAIDRALAPGGRVGIQAILMPHDRMLASKSTFTWIHKYIFPGGLIPSREAISDTLARFTGLHVADDFSLRGDYARTLAGWQRRFAENWDRIEGLGFDRTFRRMWHFYLAYSQAGFASGYLDVSQLLMERA